MGDPFDGEFETRYLDPDIEDVASRYRLATHSFESSVEGLCHYTDFGGLDGILASKSIRATFSRTLNDGTEDVFGKHVVNKFIKGVKTAMNESYVEDFILSSPVFVASFCESPKLLSMWKHYAGLGGGYCLEFDVRGLRALKHKHAPSSCFKVMYGDTLPPHVTSMLEHIARSVPQASLFAHLIALKIKHEAFKEEQEWRIAVPLPIDADIKFKPGHANIKPYIELRAADDALLPLKRILYGPTLRQDPALVESIKMMLHAYGYDELNVEVEPCNIPYQLS
jgi:hypothetical protein